MHLAYESLMRREHHNARTANSRQTIHQCPGCDAFVVLTHGPFVAISALIDWSDGMPYGRLATARTGLIRCRICLGLFFEDDAVQVGTVPPGASILPSIARIIARLNGEPDDAVRNDEPELDLPPGWKQAKQPASVELDDLLFVLANPRDLAAERLLGLRKGVWWRLNDRYRVGSDGKPMPDVPTLPADQEHANIEAILGLLEVEEDRPGAMVFRGELLRHLGRFDEAIRVLRAVPCDGRSEVRASKIERLARAGDRAVRVLK